MGNEKCILTVYNPPAEIKGGVIRIDDDAAALILQIQRDSGLSVRAIASEFIKYAAERCEIRRVSFK